MADIKNDIDSDLDQNYSLSSNADPKNMQELTIYVSNKETYLFSNISKVASFIVMYFSVFVIIIIVVIITYKQFALRCLPVAATPSFC